jgi:hypothetical protein
MYDFVRSSETREEESSSFFFFFFFLFWVCRESREIAFLRILSIWQQCKK